MYTYITSCVCTYIYICTSKYKYLWEKRVEKCHYDEYDNISFKVIEEMLFSLYAVNDNVDILLYVYKNIYL